MILAGDIGGTKARIGLFKRAGGRVDLVTVGDYVSKDFSNLSDIITAFLDTNRTLITQEIEATCFGLPGPVINGRVKVTNLPWEVVQTDIGHQIGVFKTKLVNDLVSTAAAIPTLASDNLQMVYDGGGATDKAGSCAVVAPGTGIGHSLLHREAGWSVLLASEAGHINFAPTNELEIELLRFLQKRLNHVSVESVLCGPGLVNIFNFLVEAAGYKTCAALSEPSASLIATEALSGESATAAKALEVFCEILGAHCSNIALTYLSTGGIYLGGGIPPKIAPFIVGGSFLKGYLNKGKLKERVLATPVYIIRDDRAALFGAAAIAATL
jgi:glucokinase